MSRRPSLPERARPRRRRTASPHVARPSRLGAAALAMVVAALATACGAPANDDAAPRRQPHVLILLADDLQWDALGGTRIATPHLDRFAQEGLSFTRVYNQGSEHGAVCMPSRAMFNTGRHLWRRGGDRCEGQPLMGEVFGQAGYTTFVTGKWHNGPEALARGFQHIGPTGPGMLHSTPQDGDGYRRGAAGNTWLPDDTTRGGHWMDDGEGGVVHSSVHWADQAIAFLQQRGASDDDQPFLAYVAFHAPHDPRQAPSDDLARNLPADQRLPPNVLAGHPFDNGALRLRDEQLAPFPRTPGAVALHMAEYAAIVSHMDAQVGRILAALDEAGLADDTLVVFTADHGLAVGQHGLLGKQSLYEHSTRAPWVLRGPGVPRGERRDELVYLHSTFPTLAELCDVELPPTVDAPSLAPLVRGNGAAPHDTLFAGYALTQRMVRDGRHKLVLYPQARQVQLFDLEQDPWELENLAGDPGLDHTLRRLHVALLEWMAVTEDPLGPEDVAAPWSWAVTPMRAPAGG